MSSTFLRRPHGPAAAWIADALTDAPNRRGIVVLSPHFDDACFSLGSFLAAAGTGRLINLFTRTTFLVKAEGGEGGRHPAAEDVEALRRQEDETFAARCGLHRVDLGCTEPALLGRRPCDLTHIEADLAQLDEPLGQALARFTAGPPRPLLLVPAGIGGHANHVATREWAIRHLEALEDAYDVLLYEDLPYAAHAFARRHALNALRADSRLVLGRREVRIADWAVKAALIGCYPSQLHHAPRPRQFRPAAARPWPTHEAFWPIAPRGGG